MDFKRAIGRSRKSMSKRVWLPVKGGTVLLTMRTVIVLLTATLLFDRRLLSKIT
jgi:hypothetical protein